MRKPIADWKQVASYPNPSPDKTGPQRWAFEFLRRNEEYQKDFLDYLGVCNSIVPGFNPFSWSCIYGEAQAKYARLIADDRYAVFDPPRYEGESESAWSSRVGMGARRTPLLVWYARKWGLGVSLFDPFSEYTPHVQFADSGGISVAGPDWEGFKPENENHVESLPYIIDHRKSLGPQIKAIELSAKYWQDLLERKGHIPPRKARRQRNGHKLLNYLRCLDAVDAGVTQTVIADLLSKDDLEGFDISRIGKAIAAAEKLRSREGYRVLLVTGK